MYTTHSQQYDHAQQAAHFIKQKFEWQTEPHLPLTAIVLGSGLGDLVSEIKKDKKSQSLAYEEIPFFPTVHVTGHEGCLVKAPIHNRPVLCLQGRAHGYEGFTPAEVVFPIRVLKLLQIQTLILTNAAGGISAQLQVGDFMLLTDHINLTGQSPLTGPNEPRFGPRFLDMSEAYCKSLREIAQTTALRLLNAPLKEGVYAGVAGPCYETPAEIRMLQALGADAVGMSTVHETIAARHAGMKVLGLSCITNKATGLLPSALSHEEVVAAAYASSQRFSSLILALLSSLAPGKTKT